MSENKNLEEVVKNATIIDPLDELVNLDFKEEVNIDQYSEIIHLMNRDTSKMEAEEADNIINDLGKSYIDKAYSNEINELHDKVTNYFKLFDPNSQKLKDMSFKERTNLYTVANFIVSNYNTTVDKLTFDIKLTIKEYNFLTTVLTRKMSYDGTEIFNIIELNNNYLIPWKKMVDELPKDTEYINIKIDISNIVMIYHFLQKYSVKGIGEEFYKFSSLLLKIGETNKIFNAFTVKKDRLKTSFLQWNNNLNVLDEISDEIPQNTQEIK
jgi:hypothetical protein